MKNIVHWNKQKRQWTSHTYKGCAQSPVILIEGGWHTETKPQKKDNPKGWIVSEHDKVVVDPTPEQLKQFRKVERVVYDKHQVQFSHTEGQYLLLDNEGCFLVEKE